MTGTRMVIGEKYDADSIELVGWTDGDGAMTTVEERIAQLAAKRGGNATARPPIAASEPRERPQSPQKSKPVPPAPPKPKPSYRPSSRVVEQLKESGEDFEWYPTTDEILRTVADDLMKWDRDYYSTSTLSVMDVGAGDGRALGKLQALTERENHWEGITLDPVYAIEKSQIHITNMPKHIVVIGCDFHEQMLVDKRVDVLFCNPPYSEYEQWALRILTEANAQRIYLVIPKRWRESATLQDAIEGAEVESLGEFDFENAERKARAKVEIVCITVKRDKNDAFNAAIESMLPELEAFDLEPDVRKTTTKDELNQLCEGGEIVQSLVTAYNAELDGMYEAYRGIVKMNVQLLKELGVTKESVLNGLRSKIVGLKDKYWSVLFDHLDTITKRLATKQRKQFLDSLTGKAVIDFTEPNIYSVLVWISKCACDHFDEQLVELFKALAQKATVERYKSNQKVFRDGNWRYLSDDETHYRLCYRMVIETHGGIYEGYSTWENPNGLCKHTHDIINDWITVANNLGYSCGDSTYNYEWRSGRKIELMQDDGELLMDVKAYKNGNIHIRPNKQLMLAINVQAGKLLGWLRTPEEAVTELEAEDDREFVEDMFSRSYGLTFSNVLRLTHA